MEWLLLSAGVALAFANGANDNLKGVATLYGSAQLGYRRALALATASQIGGSLASVVLATALVKAFSIENKRLLIDAEFGKIVDTVLKAAAV